MLRHWSLKEEKSESSGICTGISAPRTGSKQNHLDSKKSEFRFTSVLLLPAVPCLHRAAAGLTGFGGSVVGCWFRCWRSRFRTLRGAAAAFIRSHVSASSWLSAQMGQTHTELSLCLYFQEPQNQSRFSLHIECVFPFGSGPLVAYCPCGDTFCCVSVWGRFHFSIMHGQ